jgi:hypothetical protein
MFKKLTSAISGLIDLEGRENSGGGQENCKGPHRVDQIPKGSTN